MVDTMGRRQRRLATRRRSILEAAAVEFAETGYEKATLDGIGDRLGLSKAGLYHYVESKEQLLIDLANDAIDEIDKRVSSLTPESATARELLAVFVLAHIRVAVETPEGRVLARNLEPLLASDKAAEVRSRHQRHLEQILRTGIESGEFREMAVGPMVQMVFAAINAVPRWFEPTGPLTLADLTDQAVKILLDGICDNGAP